MFVGSAIFVDTCGRHASDAILAWLAKSFFVHAESLFFAYRKHLRCFDEYVNFVVEQQHSAVKTVRQTTTFEIRLLHNLCITLFFVQDKYRYQGHLQPRYISAMHELQSRHEGDVQLTISDIMSYIAVFCAFFRINIGSQRQHASCELFLYTQIHAQLKEWRVMHWYDIELCLEWCNYAIHLSIAIHTL